jgi:plasmid maintenance system killer protein
MIRSFRDKETERVFQREASRKFPSALQLQAQRKLVILDGAEALQDLRIPPGNRLEKTYGTLTMNSWAAESNAEPRLPGRSHDRMTRFSASMTTCFGSRSTL